MGISFDHVSHIYPGLKKKDFTVAVMDVSLTLAEKPEFTAIVGKTGSGKSTLIQHMNALLLPSRGNVLIYDKKITPKKNKNPKLKEIRKRVGFVFQFPEYQLFEETVLKDIMFAPKNFGFSEEEAKKKALEIARLMNIESILDKSPFAISGGQMRKAAIAGILSYDPDVILLDEPTRGLDPKSAQEVMDLFYDIYQKTGKSIILITHDMDLVYKYTSRVIVMKDGRVSFDGFKKDLFESGIYQENNLDKPEVLKLIDYLNAKLSLNIGYDTYTLEELLAKLEGGAYHG